jgi:hypothetical protein
LQTPALHPGPQPGPRPTVARLGSSSLEELAELHPCRTSSFAGAAAQTKVELLKNFSYLQVASGNGLHQVNAPAWRGGFVPG